MTRIVDRKTAMCAETSAMYRGRPLIVTLYPHVVMLREKGQRENFSLPWTAVYENALKLHAMEQRRLKSGGRIS